MRIEPHGVGSFVHTVKRGARGLPITQDVLDKERFVRLLFYLNDEHQDENWEREIRNVHLFERPRTWPPRRELVEMLSWTLMPNHFHFLIRETNKNGIARFMQRLCGSMTMHYNAKYDAQGSLFQGAYKGKTIDSDEYLRWAAAYVMTKNVFELYPGGLKKAIQEFEQAWKWSGDYTFSSFSDFASGSVSPIIAPTLIEMYSPEEFKKRSQEMVMSYANRKFDIYLE